MGMTSFRVPGLEIREPVRPRPFFGMLIGGLTGTIFGLLAPAGSFETTKGLQLAGFVAGGACGGLAAGALAKMFRRRLTAGIAAWFSATLGLFVANRGWHEIPEPGGIVFAGVSFAIV